MSVSIREVIESAGYDLNTEEDAKWLLAHVTEFESLIDEAEDLIEELSEEYEVDDESI